MLQLGILKLLQQLRTRLLFNLKGNISMKKYRVISWLYLVRTWLYLPTEIVQLEPMEVIRYASQIEEMGDVGTYKVRENFYLYLVRTWLYQPSEIVELTLDEAGRYASSIEEIVESQL